ncbi:MAG: hypothetical protein WAM91_08180 [Candidatus Acidiferrales bacterium]
MLSPNEEAILRKIAQEKMPSKVMNPSCTTGFGPYPSGPTIPEKLMQLPKMRVSDLNDDPEIEVRLRSADVLEPGQKPGHIYALGVSRREILTLSTSALKVRVVAARARAAQEAPPPKASFDILPGTKPAVNRLVMVG